MIGCGAARILRRLDLADQREALLFEQARGVCEAGTFARCLFDAGVQRLELRGRAVVAAAPGLPLGGDRRQPARGYLRFARQRLRFRAYLREPGAVAFDLAANAG